ncbi:MAG: hypothetical protein ACLU5J_07935 [Christensenellales bacterium]
MVNKLHPTIITKITNMNDEVLYEAKPKTSRIADESDAYLLSEAMTSVFDDNMTYNIRPTGVSIKSMLTTKYAAKSGSTDTDNWMVGYNPDIVVSVWSGYDNNKEIISSLDAKFGKYILAKIQLVAYYRITGITPSWYENRPQDVISVEINPGNWILCSLRENILNQSTFKKENFHCA